jgi:Grx4 family monothiol glutaredoxin
VLSSTDKKIDYLLQSSKVMAFIKGSPQFPQCGFTRQIIAKLNKFKVQFGHFNIFTDEELRQRLKERFDWKTYPMIFLNGELVGGNDIVDELIENEEFEEMFLE